ncbi:unnamed protein product [Closterium sp. Naga37s-1]|nr:unnamed protein product [Closterium sp. Naga37s-1]
MNFFIHRYCKPSLLQVNLLRVFGGERIDGLMRAFHLRGRSGRQGDPGSSRFFLSLEDSLLRVFGGERIDGLMRAFHVEDLPIESHSLPTPSLRPQPRRVFGGERIDGLMRAFHVEDLPIESPFLTAAALLRPFSCLLPQFQLPVLRASTSYRIDGLMRAFHVEDLPIESPFLNRALEDAQRKVENYYFDIRKQLFEYDQVLNSQRERFYSERRRALETDDLEGLMLEYAQLTMDDIVNVSEGWSQVRCSEVACHTVKLIYLEGLMLEYAELTMDDIVNVGGSAVSEVACHAVKLVLAEGLMLGYAEPADHGRYRPCERWWNQANIDPSLSQEEWNFEPLTKKVKQYCALLTDLSIDDIIYHSDTVDTLREYLHQRSKDAYYTKKAEVEAAVPGLMRDAERYFVLTQMDLLWKEHLQALRFTQQAVALRGYAQRDPLIEYKLEGYNLFLAMMGQIRRNVIYSVYQFNPVTVTQPDGGQPSGSS